jgi:hypothetical protein
MDFPTYRTGNALPTSFATPRYSQGNMQLDPLHEAAKQYRSQTEQAGSGTRPIETQRPDFDQSQQRGQEQRDRPEADEPYEREAAQDESEADEPAPARLSGPVFGGRDVSENLSDLAMEL